MKRGIIILFCLFNLLGIVSAQDEPFVIETDREISIENVRAAAQPLINRGARVAIYWLNSGDVDDFNARLQAANLMQGELIADDVIAIYVSMDPRYSEIFWGDNWNTQFAVNADNTRLNILNVNLREKQYERAFTESLEALDKILEGNTAVVPSFPTSTYNYNYKTQEKDNGMLFTFILCLVVPAFLAMNAMGIGGTGGYSGSDTPMYKSNWSSSHRSSSSSRSTSKSSSSSFGRGGRSGGKW